MEGLTFGQGDDGRSRECSAMPYSLTSPTCLPNQAWHGPVIQVLEAPGRPCGWSLGCLFSDWLIQVDRVATIWRYVSPTGRGSLANNSPIPCQQPRAYDICHLAERGGCFWPMRDRTARRLEGR